MIVDPLVATERELAEAVRHYAAKNLQLAADFLAEFDAGIKRIVAFPKAWPPVGPKGKGFRRCLLTKFPYQIVYRIEGDGWSSARAAQCD